MDKLQTDASALYALMEKNHTFLGETKVWRGQLVKTCESIGIPYGSYRKTYLALESIGCVHFISRGTRGSPTVVGLIKPPTEELWVGYEGTGTPDVALTARSEAAKILTRFQEIADQLGGVDIGKVLIDFEKRISQLERIAQPKERNGKTAKHNDK